MDKLIAYTRMCRPHQYLKNGFIWLPIFFGKALTDYHSVLLTFFAFISFCFISSTTYVINDVKDIRNDRLHPVKRHRPLASGAVEIREAFWIALILFTGAMAIAIAKLPSPCTYILIGYLLLNIAYSQGLKHIAILDIVCIAIGFVLRILIGGMAAQIYISPWIVITSFLLALFLALAKRRDDLLLASKGAQVHKAIGGYSLEYVSMTMGIMASVIIVVYILYTVSPEVITKHGTDKLFISGAWVILGLLRYLQITFVKKKRGSPTWVLIKDVVLQLVIALWLGNIYVLLYHPIAT